MERLRAIAVMIPLALPLMLAACGSDDKTVVVNPAPGQTVVVPPSGEAKVCPAGQTC